ncbi:MAG TPA: hypothetical protein VE057_12910 [Archangium sp.]|nr:hypothetical protein [Archangium sp.]
MTDKTTKSMLMAIVVLLALNLYATSTGGLIQRAHAQTGTVRCVIDGPIEVKRISDPVYVRTQGTSNLTVDINRNLLNCATGAGCAIRTMETRIP